MAVEVREFAMRAGEVDPMPGAIVVAGMGRCGMSVMMAMIEAGGVDVAQATPPFYENPKVSLPGSRWARLAAVNALALFNAATVDWTLRGPLAAGFAGKAVKLTGPHQGWIPECSAAIWMERSEAERMASAVRWYDGRMDTKEIYRRFGGGLRRTMSRRALLQAKAQILDIDYSEVVGGDATCGPAVDRIIEFLALPLDRDAMIARAAEHVRRGCPDNLITDPDQAVAVADQLAEYHLSNAEIQRVVSGMLAAVGAAR